MDFSFSRHLTCIPDLSQAPNLESLTLRGCTSLTEIPLSIQHLVKLVTLDLRSCANLRKFPASSDSIEGLHLDGCSKLKTFPISSSLQFLGLSGTAVEVLPSNFERLSRLCLLVLDGCSRLTCLPDSICRLTSLEQLHISGCSKLDRLPEELGNLENLRELNASGVPIKKIPSSMSRLKNLRSLVIRRPKRQGQSSLQLPPLLEFHHLQWLYLDNFGFTELPESLGLLSSVQILSLRENNLENIPESIMHLSRLSYLNISYCERLQSLPESIKHFSRLSSLDISYCERLQSLPESIKHLSRLSSLDISYCERLQSLPESIKHLSRLSSLDISYCVRLQSLPELPRSLRSLEAINCKSLQAVLNLSNLSTLPMELNLINCVNSNRNAIRDIVKNVLRKMFSTECAQDRIGSCGSIQFPGDKIPEWFRYQGLGSFILFKLPLDWFNDALLGFALCIVLTDYDYHDNCSLYVKLECEVKLPNGGSILLINDGDFCGWNSPKGKGPDCLVADHVHLLFFAVQGSDFCGKYLSDEISFRFHSKSCYLGKPTNCPKVKKCGASLIYKQDFVTSGESFNFDDNCF